MTHTTESMVTQADRDEAANYLRDHGYWHVDPDEFRSGEKDETPLVQAFARHRLASTRPMTEDVAGLVERLREQECSCGPDCDVKQAAATLTSLREQVARLEADKARMRELWQAAEDDHMTSEAHHPGYVLIPTAVFDRAIAALNDRRPV